jgi:hypothetical protein
MDRRATGWKRRCRARCSFVLVAIIPARLGPRLVRRAASGRRMVGRLAGARRALEGLLELLGHIRQDRGVGCPTLGRGRIGRGSLSGRRRRSRRRGRRATGRRAKRGGAKRGGADGGGARAGSRHAGRLGRGHWTRSRDRTQRSWRRACLRPGSRRLYRGHLTEAWRRRCRLGPAWPWPRGDRYRIGLQRRLDPRRTRRRDRADRSQFLVAIRTLRRARHEIVQAGGDLRLE